MIVEFSVVPLGKSESLGEPVAKVVDIIDRSGLPYKLTAMGTIVEGEWNDVFELIKECHSSMKRYAGRVLTRITIDDRDKAKGRIQGKVERVESILGRRLKT
jgi:uncharacterized protein (TIGR00106 family)